MSISFNLPDLLSCEDINHSKPLSIQGEMVLAEWSCTNYILKDQRFVNGEDEIKRILATHLAEQILKRRLAEFTKRHEVHTNTHHFRARCYMLPDEKVRILRNLEA